MKNKVICIVFLFLIAFFAITDLFSPDREFSEWENRNLKKFPTLKADTLLSGEFSQEYEEYLTDQFAFRDTFVKAKFILDKTLGKTDAGGVYITDDALYSIQSEVDENALKKNLSAIDAFQKRTGLDTSLLVVPSSTYVYRDSLPPFAKVIDEREIFEKIKKNLENVTFVDTVDKLEEKREDYIYFRTDHHWTSLGALISYNAFMNSDLTKEDFTVTTKSQDFLGTLSSKSGALLIKADIIERYSRGDVLSCTVFDGSESKVYTSMYFDDFLNKKDKYSYYLGQNQPLVRITTNSDGGKLLVFKDSYAHNLSQMMVGDWSEIVLVDLRYVKVKIDVLLKNVLGVQVSDFDKALFLYSMDTFTTQDNMLWIK